MSFSIFNSFNGNSCKLGQNYSIVSRDIDPPTTITYISADSSSVTFSFTAPTTSGTILSYTPYINGSVASGSGTPSSYTINGLTAGTQYTVNMVANIAASITAITTTTSSLLPTSVNGCAIWLDAADTSTITYSSGSKISQWNDKSGNGYSVINVNTPYQPTYGSNLLNGKGGIQLSPTGYLYQYANNIPLFSSSAATTVFFVAKNDSSPPSSGWSVFNTLYLNSAGNNEVARYHLSFAVGTTPGVSVWSNNVNKGQSTVSVAAGANAIIGTSISSTSTVISVNGTSSSYAGVTLPNANDPNTFFIIGDTRNIYIRDIVVYEMIGFNVQLSTSDHQKMEGYLAWKWGLQTSLPSNHPYYSVAPTQTTMGPGTVQQNVKSNPSVPVTLYTLGTFPTNLQFISSTSNSITVKFNPSIGTITRYTPYVNGSVATGSGTTSSYTISGLTAGTTYSVAIAANSYLDTSASLFQYYRFEQSDVSGTKLLNYATNSYDASFVNGSTIISTTDNYKVGYSALNLISDHNYATSPYVTIPSINVTTNGLSFSLWFRSNCNAPIGTAPHIFEYGNGQNSDNVFMFIYPPNVSTGNLGFEVYSNTTNSNGFSYSPITAINDNVWRHVVWTLSYSTTKNSTWNIYLNGSFSSTTTGYYPRNISRTGNYIGKSGWSTDEMFNGQIDDFRVYNAVLSASDVSQLYAYNPNILKSSSVSMATTN